jgi:methyl-accepting chemotaxis protein
MEKEDQQVMATAFFKAVESDPRPTVLTDKNLKILIANRAFVNIIGIQEERLLEMTVPELGSQGIVKYLENSGEAAKEALEKKKKTSGRSEIQTPAGHFFIDRTSNPVVENGVVTHVVITYNDVTAYAKSQKYMETQFARLAEGYARIGAGDLTVRIEIDEPDKDTEEAHKTVIGVRDSVRMIIIPLQKTITKIKETNQEVAAAAEEVTANTEEISAATHEVAGAATSVDANVDKVEQSMNQISVGMNDSAAATQQVATLMAGVSNQANKVKTASEKGVGLSERSLQVTHQTVTSSHNADKAVQEMIEWMEEVTKVVVLISEIANQTNLLALNAAIEAARAGEAGRGFAVVAAEVKSLALDSKEKAGNIKEIIDKAVKSGNTVSQQMKVALSSAEEGGTAVEETAKAFTEIYEIIQEIAQGVGEAAAATEEQAASAEEITASAHEVLTIITETKKQASNTAAASEETSAGIDQITTAMTRVAKIAEEMLVESNKFKV